MGKRMPIYMDRHDIEGATAKAVADAHQKDLKLQDKYGVKLLTYWFDEGRGSAFCLMDASAKEKVKQLHEEAHGMIPHKIMEVNPDTVEAFLGRIEDPQPASESLTPSSETFKDLTNLYECMKSNGRKSSLGNNVINLRQIL
jgi:hypothetical protein